VHIQNKNLTPRVESIGKKIGLEYLLYVIWLLVQNSSMENHKTLLLAMIRVWRWNVIFVTQLGVTKQEMLPLGLWVSFSTCSIKNNLLELGCCCKNELAMFHYCCALKWCLKAQSTICVVYLCPMKNMTIAEIEMTLINLIPLILMI
jgi:hypothetical protein